MPVLNPGIFFAKEITDAQAKPECDGISAFQTALRVFPQRFQAAGLRSPAAIILPADSASPLILTRKKHGFYRIGLSETR